MFKNLADDAAIMLITHHIIPEDKRAAYTYGFELLFEKLFFYGIILIIALLTKTLIFSILFMFSYKMLRQYTGGFHCKTAEVCLVVSVLIYLLALLLYLLNFDSTKFVLAIGTIVSFIIIFLFSPRESKNRPLECEEKKKYRIFSIIVGAVTAIIAAISYKLNISLIFYSTSCSLTADAVLIILSLGRCKNEEDSVEGFGGNG